MIPEFKKSTQNAGHVQLCAAQYIIEGKGNG